MLFIKAILPLRSPEWKVRVLERRQYLRERMKKAKVVCKHESKLLAQDAPVWTRKRLSRPSLEEEEKSRLTARLPSHVYVTPVRREERPTTTFCPLTREKRIGKVGQ